MPDCYLALGANLGPIEENFDRALKRLAAFQDVRVIRTSTTYRTKPVGAHAGSEFLNAACHLWTDIPPLELLDRMQSIENQLGRVRNVRWGPRPIDLDLLFYGDHIIRLPRLRVPHPAAWYRRFVLDPMHEIAADFVHPEKGLTIFQLRQRLVIRPLPFALAGGSARTRQQTFTALRAGFPDAVTFSEWPASGAPLPESEPAIIAWLGPDDASTIRFDALPVVPRLDASGRGEQTVEFLADVLHAALGE